MPPPNYEHIFSSGGSRASGSATENSAGVPNAPNLTQARIRPNLREKDAIVRNAK
jgi:hypothetical protein